jgi:hypothetical protein
MHADNSAHLTAAARRRSEQTLARARAALRELQDAGQPITITALAARAGVSRGWLYTQHELRQQISPPHAPAPAQPASNAERASSASLRQRLTLAHQRIRDLSDDNQQLRDQIASLHGQLRAARLGSPHVTDTVHDTNSQVRPTNGQNDRR